VNLHTDDTGILAGLILISSAVTAAIPPRGCWPAALAIGASVIASEFYRSGRTVGRHILLGDSFFVSASLVSEQPSLCA
jgi:hypothetical protein